MQEQPIFNFQVKYTLSIISIPSGEDFRIEECTNSLWFVWRIIPIIILI